MNKERRNIFVDVEIWNRVREILGVHGSISKLIRELLAEWLKKQEAK